MNEIFEHSGHLRRYIVSLSFLPWGWRPSLDERMKRNEGFDFVVAAFNRSLRGGRRTD